MYQEDTEEDDDYGKQQEAEAANAEARFEYEAEEMQQTLWAGTPHQWTAVDIFRDLAIGMAQAQAAVIRAGKKEVA